MEECVVVLGHQRLSFFSLCNNTMLLLMSFMWLEFSDSLGGRWIRVAIICCIHKFGLLLHYWGATWVFDGLDLQSRSRGASKGRLNPAKEFGQDP
ncbi:hypothetical protein Fmac_001427 [Flemingia macrophylla]|uniref:Transmembrane protein n=1 Tax=Flemingia macrophylla TaxID=520843 RepID=A0ABD1NH23_9FABA